LVWGLAVTVRVAGVMVGVLPAKVIVSLLLAASVPWAIASSPTCSPASVPDWARASAPVNTLDAVSSIATPVD
jgi:hypothetical protein